VVPVGGSHLTNDLSLGLRLTEGQGEKIKLRFGRGTVTARDKGEKVWLNGDFAIGARQFPRQAIEQITAARVWEIFEVVKKRLGATFVPEHTVAGVVLTGGTSKLPGIELTHIFNRNVARKRVDWVPAAIPISDVKRPRRIERRFRPS